MFDIRILKETKGEIKLYIEYPNGNRYSYFIPPELFELKVRKQLFKKRKINNPAIKTKIAKSIVDTIKRGCKSYYQVF